MRVRVSCVFLAAAAFIFMPPSPILEHGICSAGTNMTAPSVALEDDCPFHGCFGSVPEMPDCTMSACGGIEGIRCVSGCEYCEGGLKFFQACCSEYYRFCPGCID